MSNSFFTKLESGNIIKFLPNIKADGSIGEDLIVAPSVWVPSGKGGGLYYDIPENPLMSKLPRNHNKYKEFIIKFLAYGLVDGEYKMIQMGSQLMGKIRNYTSLTSDNNIGLKVNIVNKTFPDYSNSFISSDILKEFYLTNTDLMNKHINSYKLFSEDPKKFMLNRPFSIEEFIDKNSIISSQDCYKYFTSDESVKKITLPYFRKHRINLILNDLE